MHDKADTKKKSLTASPLEEWKRAPGRPRTTDMKTVLHDPKSYKLTMTAALNMSQNRPLRTGGYWLSVTLYIPVVQVRIDVDDDDDDDDDDSRHFNVEVTSASVSKGAIQIRYYYYNYYYKKTCTM